MVIHSIRLPRCKLKKVSTVAIVVVIASYIPLGEQMALVRGQDWNLQALGLNTQRIKLFFPVKVNNV